MSYDRSEKRTYRRSPGRQYGYDYDPLRSQPLNANGQPGRSDTSPRSEPLSGFLKDTDSLGPRRASGPLSPRPNPRRTRQLLRQQILSTKKAGTSEDTGQLDPDINTDYDLVDEDQDMYEDDIMPRPTRRRSGTIQPYPYPVPPRRPVRTDEDRVERPLPLPYEKELDYLDPDVGYEDEELDPLAGRVSPAAAARTPLIERGRRRSTPLAEPDTYEEEQQNRKQKRKKGFFSRRKLLVGAVLVGGGAVAAYELGPKIPQALESAGSNIEHQIQNAFNQGFAAGGEAVRKELINGLDTLEGISLEAAIGAAKLTRVAYDVFVNPIVTLASTIADDFLSALLNALITARGWLKQINADNATLVALTSVLQNWVDQAHNMPKKLQTITETDLDGAQGYLRALERKIQDEQAKLNGQSPTPTPSPTSTPKH